MNTAFPPPAENPRARLIQAGEDWHGEQRGLRMSQIDFKVVTAGGDLLIIENTFQAGGGPPRHLHHDQEEWFYAVRGEFIFEVGQERFLLRPGDSLLAPRKVPHVWAFTGGGQGKILIAFQPAGQMEAFFRAIMQGNVPPPVDPEVWRRHGMELLGPPLALAQP
jgi:quercetin dioxygenase-like cupin family protein